MSEKSFFPRWEEEAPAPGTYRHIFKWGDPHAFKHPNRRLYALLKEHLEMSDADFQSPRNQGNGKVSLEKQPPRLAARHLHALKAIVGNKNVSTDDYARACYACGKTVEEALELRQAIVPHVPDLVVHPRNKEDVKKIVDYCHAQKIPLYVYGGGSSVNMGFRPEKGGITLALSTHMNKVLEVNELNQSATVQAGALGPAYEQVLNEAPSRFGTKWAYTCGHFPQSFEYSSVGGWVLTLGSGQQSSYYGDAYDLVLSMECVTPRGLIKTCDFPASATGPKLNDILKGSEGIFGVVTELTMKVFRHMPGNRRSFSFILPSWEDALAASREIAQGEFGMPSVLRISDPEETDIAMALYSIAGTPLDTMMALRGYKANKRCLLIGQADGHKSLAINIKQQAKLICKNKGGMYLTAYPVTKWRHSRYKDPYLREDLQDFGVVTDTLETSVNWDNIIKVHQGVRAYIKARPNTICMTHASHFYPQGTNLYFIFMAKMSEIGEYRRFQAGILEAIAKNGGSLSHHHGIGRMIAPWLKDYLGQTEYNALLALKRHFDPHGIMNPGALLSLPAKPSR